MKFIISISSTETDFSELKDPVDFLDCIRKREIWIEEARHKQEEFNRYLKKNKKKKINGNKYGKQKKLLANINKPFNGKNDSIKFVDDYGSMTVETKRKAAEEEPKPEPTKAKTKRKYLHLNCMKNL